MNLFSDLASITACKEPMERHTSFRVGGTVDYFIRPENTDQFHLVYQRCHTAGRRIRVLGRGSNVLVADGEHHWVVVSTEQLNRYQRMGSRLRVDAGMSLGRLLVVSGGQGLGGLETLAGIPGSVGGAVAMNAGGRGGSIGDRLISARVAFPGGLPREMAAADLGLGYRTSYLVDGLPCLLSATFQLDPASPDHLERTRRALILEKRKKQPMHEPSAGCVFKNPPGLSAGELIDTAGLKNETVGGAAVSDVHANFIVNRGGATASQVLELIELIVERVWKVHTVRLELEVKVWDDHYQETPPGDRKDRKERQWDSLTSPEWPSSTAATPTSAMSR